MQSNFEYAEFTEVNELHGTCGRCQHTFEKSKLFYMHDVRMNEPGRWLCAPCRGYYRDKTRRRQQASSQAISTDGLHRTDHSHIHDQNSAAQRGDIRGNIKAIGQAAAGHACDTRMPPPALPPHVPVNGPYVGLPGPVIPHPPFPMVFPKTYRPQAYGYNEAHALYNELRDRLSTLAYSGGYTELITVKARMMTWQPNRKQANVVGNIAESMNNIPVNIGVKELKDIVFTMLLKPFFKWFNDFPLSLDDVVLRDKNWVEYVALDPQRDANAVSASFFSVKGRRGTKKFNPGQGIDVLLELPWEKFEAANAHKLECEAAVSPDAMQAMLAPLSSNTKHIRTNRNRGNTRVARKASSALEPQESESGGQEISASPKAGPSRGKRRRSSTAESSGAMFQLRPVTSSFGQSDRPAKRAASDSFKSLQLPAPDSLDIEEALRAQKPPTEQVVQALLNTISLPCLIYVSDPKTFTELIVDPTVTSVFKSIAAVSANLTYDPTDKPKLGSFKEARFGHTSIPIFGRASRKVCIKQAIYRNPGSKKALRYDGHAQAEKLSLEIKCSYWANALMDLVYDYISEVHETKGTPSFDVPNVRFVKTALATVQGATPNAFLLEEVIDAERDGPFRKYVNNDSTMPALGLKSAMDLHLASFFVFCQHVQYLKTERLAYVSDYQGGGLLSDPQIITAEKLGRIFADGNVSFEFFESAHTCNHFCQFYGLERFSTEVEGSAGGEDVSSSCQSKSVSMLAAPLESHIGGEVRGVSGS